MYLDHAAGVTPAGSGAYEPIPEPGELRHTEVPDSAESGEQTTGNTMLEPRLLRHALDWANRSLPTIRLQWYSRKQSYTKHLNLVPRQVLYQDFRLEMCVIVEGKRYPRALLKTP